MVETWSTSKDRLSPVQCVPGQIKGRLTQTTARLTQHQDFFIIRLFIIKYKLNPECWAGSPSCCQTLGRFYPRAIGRGTNASHVD